jgi:hypothetical protein
MSQLWQALVLNSQRKLAKVRLANPIRDFDVRQGEIDGIKPSPVNDPGGGAGDQSSNNQE